MSIYSEYMHNLCALSQTCTTSRKIHEGHGDVTAQAF